MKSGQRITGIWTRDPKLVYQNARPLYHRLPPHGVLCWINLTSKQSMSFTTLGFLHMGRLALIVLWSSQISLKCAVSWGNVLSGASMAVEGEEFRGVSLVSRQSLSGKVVTFEDVSRGVTWGSRSSMTSEYIHHLVWVLADPDGLALIFLFSLMKLLLRWCLLSLYSISVNELNETFTNEELFTVKMPN